MPAWLESCNERRYQHHQPATKWKRKHAMVVSLRPTSPSPALPQHHRLPFAALTQQSLKTDAAVPRVCATSLPCHCAARNQLMHQCVLPGCQWYMCSSHDCTSLASTWQEMLEQKEPARHVTARRAWAQYRPTQIRAYAIHPLAQPLLICPSTGWGAAPTGQYPTAPNYMSQPAGHNAVKAAPVTEWATNMGNDNCTLLCALPRAAT